MPQHEIRIRFSNLQFSSEIFISLQMEIRIFKVYEAFNSPLRSSVLAEGIVNVPQQFLTFNSPLRSSLAVKNLDPVVQRLKDSFNSPLRSSQYAPTTEMSFGFGLPSILF